MASKLGPPWRRFLHTTACRRYAPRALPSAGPPGQLDNKAFLELVNEAVAHNYKNPPQSTKTETENAASQMPLRMRAFTNQSFIRPIDLSREFRSPKRTGRSVQNVPPGREARYNDAFLQLGVDPRFECENAALMSDFASRMGKIQPRTVTLLSQRSQRLMGKAVKRAKMMGIIPMFSNKGTRGYV